MNFTISKEQLLNGLQAVQNIVTNRTTLPILSNVLLRMEADKLEMTATDLDVTIVCSVAADSKEAGVTTLPVKKLFGIVRELSGTEVEFKVDDKNRCSLTSGPSYYKIHGLAGEEFPPTANFKEQRKVTLPQDKFKGMLRKTAFATSTDESRYVLNGIYVILKDHKMTIVATDGRRLALAEEEVDIPEKGQAEFIVPTKAVSELNRLLGDQGEIEIQVGDNQAAFRLKSEKGPSVMLITKLIEGNYPNYKQVIPGECKERIQLAREEFMHALRRAEIMTSDKQNSVKLAFGKNILTINANTPEVGEGLESIAINYSGKEMAIAFNPGYLIEPLNALTEDDVYFELIDELSPGVLKVNGPFLYVVMPMRLS